MSNRTRSNTKWDKMPLSSSVDHFQIISQFVGVIVKTKEKLAQEMSYRTPDAKFIARCNESIQNCFGTIKKELLNIGIEDKIEISKIVEFIKKSEFNTAYSNVQKMIENKCQPMGYRIR